MAKIYIPETGPQVYCPNAEQYDAEPITYTNVYNGNAHCSYCGATDHAKASNGAVSWGENATADHWAEFAAYAN